MRGLKWICGRKGRKLRDSGGKGVEYVAISHVWSDGLGNPRSNALPRCQLDRISHLVRELYEGEPVGFWMDTICCPASPGAAKKLALARMGATYKDADKVLVLESSLLKLAGAQGAKLSVIVNILRSGWVNRRWTLQEGFFAKHLCFQLADVAVDFRDFDDWIIEQDDELEAGSIYTSDLILIFPRFCGRMKRESLSHQTIEDLADELAVRSTTKATDEPFCLGTLLDLDMSEILAADPENRMQAFWSSLPEIPVSALYCRWHRLSRPGFRWAPSLFLEATDSVLPRHGDTTRGNVTELTKRGLQTRCLGLRLSNIQAIPMYDEFVIMDEALEWSYIMCNRSSTQDDSKGPIQHWTVPGDMLDASAAILVQSFPSITNYYVHATLVYIVEEIDDTIFARRSDTGLLMMLTHPNTPSVYHDRKQRYKEESMEEDEFAEGKMTCGNGLDPTWLLLRATG